MTRTTVRRRTFGAVAAIGALLALSACGGAAEGAEDTAPPDADAQALAFAECMREEGVDMPDPAPGQRGLAEALQHGADETRDRAAIEQALAACQDLAPQYDHEPGHDQQREEAMLELAECLRGQGLDVPDNLSGAFHDVDDDELMAAYEECRGDDLVGGDHG